MTASTSEKSMLAWMAVEALALKRLTASTGLTRPADDSKGLTRLWTLQEAGSGMVLFRRRSLSSAEERA